MNQHTFTHFNENSKIPNIKVIRDYLKSVKCDNFDEVFLYIENKDYNALKELLAKENPDDENSLFYARDGEGRTPLMFAALLGDIKAVQILLEPFEGIKVYNYIGITSEPFKWNAIFYAIFGGNAEVVAILLERSQLEDYLSYRDIFNWSSFDYLMLSEKLFLELFEMSNECNMLQNWIGSSYSKKYNIKKEKEKEKEDLSGDKCIEFQKNNVPFAGIASQKSEMTLNANIIYIIVQGQKLVQIKQSPQRNIVLNDRTVNIFYNYYFPSCIAYLEGNYKTLEILLSKFGSEQAILENIIGETLFWEMLKNGNTDNSQLKRIFKKLFDEFYTDGNIFKLWASSIPKDIESRLLKLLEIGSIEVFRDIYIEKILPKGISKELKSDVKDLFN